MYCKNCGTELAEEMLFCPECGTKNEVPEQEQTVKQEEVPEEAKTVIYEKVIGEVVEEQKEDAVHAEAGEGTAGGKAEQEEGKTEKGNAEAVSTPVLANGMVSVDRVKYCHNCGTANAEGDMFCCSCGKPFQAETEQPEKKKKVPVKYIWAGAGAVVVLFLVLLLIRLGGGSGEKPLLYLKDNEINGVLGNGKGYVVSEDTFKDDDSVTGPYSPFFQEIQFTDDYKYIFYPKEMDGGRFSLYCREYGKEKAEEIKVDSDILSYYVVGANKIIYKKDGDRLYFSDLKDKEKVASDVAWFQVSEDRKYILWMTNDGEGRLYIQDIALKNEKIKADSDISYVVEVSDDLKKIVYMKDDVLYMVKDFTEKERIASSVQDVSAYDNNGKMDMYYIVNEGGTTQMNINALIEDDYAQEDAAIVEPDITDYQRIETKPSFWGTQESVVTDEAYYAAAEKYQEKLQRDEIRRELSESLDIETCEVYYYNGTTGESECIQEGIVLDYCIEEPVLLCMVFEEEDISPLKLSALMEMEDYEIYDKLMKNMLDGVKMRMFRGNRTMDLETDWEEYEIEFYNFYASGETEECYLLLTETDGGDDTLFQTSFASGGSLELLAEDVGTVELVTDKGIYYTTESDGQLGELYFNSQKVDSDVKLYSCNKLENGGILYIKDPDDRAGTLCIYENGKKEKIADDVASYVEQKEGSICFLEDYNFTKYRGDLKVYSKGKINQVDSDVACILK